jgi:hypothetical protein
MYCTYVRLGPGLTGHLSPDSIYAQGWMYFNTLRSRNATFSPNFLKHSSHRCQVCFLVISHKKNFSFKVHICVFLQVTLTFVLIFYICLIFSKIALIHVNLVHFIIMQSGLLFSIFLSWKYLTYRFYSERMQRDCVTGLELAKSGMFG